MVRSGALGPALDRPALLFTDERGRVVLIEDGLARLLGYAQPDDALGDPLETVLGIPPDNAKRVLKEISSKGQMNYHPVEVKDRRSGSLASLLLHGSARYEGGRFIGADITVTPPAFTIPGDYFGHRANLERMAAMVRARMEVGGAPAISEATELELRSYFAARMLAVYVLLVRMGGRSVGQALEERIGRLSQERGFVVGMHGGRVELGPEPLQPRTCQELMQLAVDYAVKVTSLRVVMNELSDLDSGFDQATLERAARFGLREKG